MKERQFDLQSFVLRLASVLLMLVLLTSGLVSGRYARYVTRASGSDSARVARFVVTEQSIKHGGLDLKQSQDIPMPAILPGETVTIDVIVEHDAEVAVENVISVENITENIPLKFDVHIKGADKSGVSVYREQCQPGKHTKAYTAEITWPKSDDSVRYMDMVDMLSISVVTQQID